MKRHALDHLLGSPAKVAVLRILCTMSTELTGRETARLAGVSGPQAIKALNELTARQVVIRRQAGRAGLYALNDAFALARKGLVPLFRQESSLLETTLTQFSREIGASVISLVLFGSRARRDETADSDVDLLVLVKKIDPDLRRRVLEKAQTHSGRLGFHLSPLILTLDECRKASGQKKSLIATIIRDGRTIIGKPLKELLDGEDA